MRLVQIVAPTQEPITLEDAKSFLRVLDNDSDNIINNIIIAVREHVENITNRQLNSATFELYNDSFVKKLPKNPIQSILKIEYMDNNGNYIAMDNSLYYLYENFGIGMIEYLDMPILCGHKESVKITFVCGYLSVPEVIKAYMRVKISTLFENREEFVIGASISNFGGSLVENMLANYRVIPT